MVGSPVLHVKGVLALHHSKPPPGRPACTVPHSASVQATSGEMSTVELFRDQAHASPSGRFFAPRTASPSASVLLGSPRWRNVSSSYTIEEQPAALRRTRCCSSARRDAGVAYFAQQRRRRASLVASARQREVLLCQVGHPAATHAVPGRWSTTSRWAFPSSRQPATAIAAAVRSGFTSHAKQTGYERPIARRRAPRTAQSPSNCRAVIRIRPVADAQRSTANSRDPARAARRRRAPARCGSPDLDLPAPTTRGSSNTSSGTSSGSVVGQTSRSRRGVPPRRVRRREHARTRGRARLLLIDGAAGVPQLRVADDRLGGHRRHQRGHERRREDHRLVKNDQIAGEATAAATGAGLEEDAVAVAKLDRLGALAAHHLQDRAGRTRARPPSGSASDGSAR
jgi:hypothetical protein